MPNYIYGLPVNLKQVHAFKRAARNHNAVHSTNLQVSTKKLEKQYATSHSQYMLMLRANERYDIGALCYRLKEYSELRESELIISSMFDETILV